MSAFPKIDEIQLRLLEEVAGLHEVPEGAYNIRANGKLADRVNSANIEIVSKEDGTGIDILLSRVPRRKACIFRWC